jgi:Glycosyl hydrolase family 26
MSRRRLGRIAAACLALVSLAFAGFALAAVPGHAASAAGLGVYRGAAAPQAVGDFGSWLGRRPEYALDYFPGDTWVQIETPDWWLNSWAGTPYTVEYSVPIIPQSGGTLQEGAAGEYNRHFQKLAQTLLAHGQQNAILRLGWEFNGSWYKWFAGNDPAAFAAYWRQIVTTMRGVAPGLRFDWCPTLGLANMTRVGLQAAYPGSAYVDYIGTDVYDQAWGPNNSIISDPAVRWNTYATQTNGLNWVASFAASEGKPITIPEWGLAIRSDGHGGGDNAYFIQRMHDWITSHNVAFQMYFEFDASDGAHRLMTDQFPIGSQTYRQLFAGAPPATSSSSTSSSSTASTTTTTTPKPSCHGAKCRRFAQSEGPARVMRPAAMRRSCSALRPASSRPTWVWTLLRHHWPDRRFCRG